MLSMFVKLMKVLNIDYLSLYRLLQQLSFFVSHVTSKLPIIIKMSNKTRDCLLTTTTAFHFSCPPTFQ